MRRMLIIVLFSFLQMICAYTWHTYPSRGNKIYDYHETTHFGAILCTDSGLVNQQNQLYRWADLIPIDVADYNQDTLLVAMGIDNSYSDGIYKFSRDGNFSVVNFYGKMNFITKNTTDNFYYAGHGAGLVKSADGNHWTSVPYFNGKNCQKLVFSGNKMAVIIPTNNMNVSYTTDSGNNWSNARLPFTNAFLCDIDFNPVGELTGLLGCCSNSDGVWIYNPVSNWWNVLLWTDVPRTFLINDSTYWLGYRNGSGVASFFPDFSFVNGLPNNMINKLKKFTQVNTPSIICCTDNGAYFLTGYNSIGVQDTKSSAMLSAYPNPFNNSSTISYTLDVSNYARLTVFNAKGELVQTLINSIQSAGKHSICFDADGLNSGVYYYKLETNGKSSINKIILLK